MNQFSEQPAEKPIPVDIGNNALMPAEPKALDASVIGFWLIAAVLITGCALGYLNARRLDDNRRMVSHSQELIASLESLLSTVKDAETGQRGYLLVEDLKYLEPYDDALRRVKTEFKQLNGLTSDNADHQATLARLALKIDTKLDELNRTVELLKGGDRPSALKIVRSDLGKDLMDDVRKDIAAIEQAEVQMLKKWNDESEASYRTTLWSILLPAILGLLLLGVVLYLSQRIARHRHRAATAISEQKERLRTTLASIGDAVISTDRDGDITYLNAVAESLTGWKNDEATGVPLTHVFNIVNESTRLPVENPAFRALKEGVIVGLANHTVLIAKDGTERPIDDSAAPIRCKLGELVGCVLVFRDITDRKLEEMAQAERLRLVSLRADVSTVLGTPESTSICLQNCCEALVRHLDMAFARIWTLEDPATVLELQASAGIYTHLNGPHSRVPVGQYKIGRIASSREPHFTNSVPQDPQVSDREWATQAGMVAFAGYPLLVENRVVGVVAMFARHPLTEGVLSELAPLADSIAQFIDRRRAEVVIQSNERRLRFILDSMPQKVFTANDEGEVDYFNPIWTDFSGLSFEQIRDWGWTQFIHPDDVADNVRIWKQSISTGEPFQFEHRFRRSDGVFRWHVSRAKPLKDGDGKILMWVGANTDIHDQRQTQDELRDVAAKLSEADRRKDEFLATLAHELRNPLAPIRNGLQVMKLAGTNAAVIEESRTMMERQLDQMVRLVDDLMDVSRISRGKLELKIERIELAAVVNSAVETSRPLIDQMGHELTVTLPDLPVVIDADLTRLAQVFLNLLNNAAKYSDQGGQIRLTADRQGNEIVVSVRDTGIGIASNQLPHIFEMFSQLDHSLEKSQGGLGIGLTLVRRLVQMHGGSVNAHSEGLGKGSEFIVRLPVVVESSMPQDIDRDDEQVKTNSSLRVLIVDDNRDSADSLAMMLQVMGNDTFTAYDGNQAVILASEIHPDVILLDIGLPKLNGYEVCRRIRAMPGGKTSVIIAQTGWGQEEDRQRTHDAGFNHHLVKPVDPMALMKLLSRLAQESNGQSEHGRHA